MEAELGLHRRVGHLADLELEGRLREGLGHGVELEGTEVAALGPARSVAVLLGQLLELLGLGLQLIVELGRELLGEGPASFWLMPAALSVLA